MYRYRHRPCFFSKVSVPISLLLLKYQVPSFAWFNSNKLTLNYTKRQCLLEKSPNHSSKIKLGDAEVTNNNTVKYLGTVLDDKLTWRYHNQMVTKKLSIAVGILSKLRHYTYPKLFLLKFVMVLPTHTYIQKIQVLQNRLIKVICNTFKFKTKLLPLYQELNILKFHNIYCLEVIKFTIKHKNGKLPALFNDYFTLTSKIHNHMIRQASKNNFFMRRVTNSSTQ